jgi:adenylate kinase
MQNVKNFIPVLGPQGSGKSTQAKLLAEFLHYKFISTGEVLRKLKDENNPVGLKLSRYWVTGELVPDELIEEILFPILENTETFGFILDGYPRNLNQLNSFINFLKMNNWNLQVAIYLEVGENECLDRLKKRTDLEKREDETEEAIKRRLEIYKSETAPLLNKYEEMGKLKRINGERGIEEIQKDIREFIKISPKNK